MGKLDENGVSQPEFPLSFVIVVNKDGCKGVAVSPRPQRHSCARSGIDLQEAVDRRRLTPKLCGLALALEQRRSHAVARRALSESVNTSRMVLDSLHVLLSECPECAWFWWLLWLCWIVVVQLGRSCETRFEASQTSSLPAVARDAAGTAQVTFVREPLRLALDLACLRSPLSLDDNAAGSRLRPYQPGCKSLGPRLSLAKVREEIDDALSGGRESENILC